MGIGVYFGLLHVLAWVMIQIQMVGGDLAVGDEKYFEPGFGRNKLFQVLMYEETQL